MSTLNELTELASREYAYGFVTDIDEDLARRELSEARGSVVDARERADRQPFHENLRRYLRGDDLISLVRPKLLY
ncbi:MAG TPA: hypothetical protein VN786_09740 [Acidimicrobiales bacterium]|nr:hypothetical protein [Acidimicrobiales bacterium]